MKCQQNTCFAGISGLDALFLLVELTALFTYHFEVIDNLKYSLGGKDLLVIISPFQYILYFYSLRY